MEKEIEDELPQSVKDEIDAAKKEGADETPEAPAEDEQPERVRLSRRAQKEEERKAEVAAANERAERAAQLAEQIRLENAERFARLEGMIGGLAQGQRPYQEQQRQTTPEDAQARARQLRREADQLLVDGKISDYHEKRDEAEAILRAADKEELRRSMQQQYTQTQQQAPQTPDWVRAVEAQFPDVIMHPAGKNAVVSFAQIEVAKTGRPVDPQGLMRAYTRAREELGMAKRNDSNIEARRQQLASGPGNGATRGVGAAKDQVVNMPKGWRDVAKKAGIPEKEYVKHWAAANPGDVSNE